MGVVVAAALLATIAAAVMLRTDSPAPGGRTVGGYFDTPPAWPGPAWRHGNRTASWPELDASAGPSQCGWQALTFFTLGWPLGNPSPIGPWHQYIRDPFAHLGGAHELGTWAHNPNLPADALDTGYHYATVRLYLAGSDQDRYVYIVAPGDSERWPRSDPVTECL